MIEKLDIQFGATTTGVGPAVREAVGQIHSVQDAVEVLSGFCQGMRENIREMFLPPPDRLTPEVREATREVDRLGDKMEQTTRKSSAMSAAMGGIGAVAKGAIVGLVAGVGIDRVINWMDSMSGAAERLDQLSQRLNMSHQDLQGWGMIVKTNGLETEAFATAVTKLEQNAAKAASGAKIQAGALHDLSISADMAKNSNEMLLQIADKFSQMDDGPKKIALAMALLGRSGADLIPIFNQGRAALEEQMGTAQRYGAIMDESVVQKALAMDAAMDESSLAFQGLSNIMMDSTGPGLTHLTEGMNTLIASFVDSYQKGGLAKSILDIIGDACKVLLSIVVALGWGVYAAFDTINGIIWYFDGVVKRAFESVRQSIISLIENFRALGTVMYDVLTFQWGRIAGDIEAGMQKVAVAVANGRAAIAAAGQESFNNSAAAFGRVDKSYGATDQFIKGIWSGGGGNTAPPKPRPSAGTDMQLTGVGGGGGSGPSAVQKWEQDLHRQQIASQDYFRDQNAKELAFWQDKLALTTQGSKDWYAVQDKIFTAAKALAQQQYQEQISSLDFQIQSQRDNYSEQAALEQQKVDLVRRTYGEQSSQYQQVLREQLRMARQHQEELVQIEMNGMRQRMDVERTKASANVDISRGALETESQMVQYYENAGLLSRQQAAQRRTQITQQELALQAQHEQQLYEIQQRGLREQLAIEGLRPQQMAQINAELERLEAEHLARMQVLRGQQTQAVLQGNIAAADAVRQTWLDRLQPVTQALGTMVNGFLMGTTNLRSAVLQMGSQILQQVSNWLLKWVATHVAAERAKTAATVAGNVSRTASDTATAATGMALTTSTATAEITTNAAVAGSGALASISKIPVIGPYIAPAIAAGIMALAMGFIGRIASAEGGWDQVPGDGMVTELHKDEMVLPATFANPLRSLLRGGEWGLGSTGAATRGARSDAPVTWTDDANTVGEVRDVHLHLSALDSKSGARWLMDQRAEVAAALKQAVRDGHR